MRKYLDIPLTLIVTAVLTVAMLWPINQYYALGFYITDNFTQSVKQPVTRFDLGLFTVVDRRLIRTL